MIMRIISIDVVVALVMIAVVNGINAVRDHHLGAVTAVFLPSWRKSSSRKESYSPRVRCKSKYT